MIKNNLGLITGHFLVDNEGKDKQPFSLKRFKSFPDDFASIILLITKIIRYQNPIVMNKIDLNSNLVNNYLSNGNFCNDQYVIDNNLGTEQPEENSITIKDNIKNVELQDNNTIFNKRNNNLPDRSPCQRNTRNNIADMCKE